MFARPLAIPSEVFASGGCRGGARALTLFWMKKEEMTEGRKAGLASKIEPGAPPWLKVWIRGSFKPTICIRKPFSCRINRSKKKFPNIICSSL